MQVSVLKIISSGLLKSNCGCIKKFKINTSVFFIGLIFVKLTHATELSVVGPCDSKPLLQLEVNLANEEKITLGDLTVKILNEKRIPFKGNASGIVQIVDSPTGQESIEILNSTSYRAYGWCVHIDNFEPAEMPDTIIITKRVARINWFYAYSLFDNGVWKDYCTPSWKMQSLPYCKKQPEQITLENFK